MKGCMMANYLVLNAEARQYFQRFICMSGTAIDFNAISYENHINEMYNFARNISQPANNIAELIEVLKSASAKEILDFTSQIYTKKLEKRKWAPIIESMYFIRIF